MTTFVVRASAALLTFAAVAAFSACAPEGSGNPSSAASGDASPSAVPTSPDAGRPTVAEFWDDGALRVGIVGDSITVGWMADAEDRTYRRQVADADYDGALQLDWVAEVGYTSAQMLPLARDVIAGAEVVVVATGTNDGKTGPAGLVPGYADLLAAVPDDRALLCLGPWRRGADVSDAAESACTAAGGTFLSTESLWAEIGPPDGTGWPVPRDEFHPNQRGHDALAEMLSAALRGA